MEIFLLITILIAIIIVYLRQERYNTLLVNLFHNSENHIKQETVDHIYVNDLIKLYYSIRNKHNIQILRDEEIVKLKNNKK